MDQSRMTATKICLFIPAYQVQGSIGRVIDRLPAEALDRIELVLVVDNHSSDASVEEAKASLLARRASLTAQAPRFRLLRNHRNISLGGSTIVAFREAIDAGSDFLICLHGDGQADPAELPTFISNCRPGIDFVFGSRMLPGSATSDYSKTRLAGNLMFAWLQKKLVGVEAQDIGAYIAFNLHTVRKLPFESIPPDMGYHPNLVMLAFKRGFRSFVEFPISWGAADRTNVNPWSYGLRHLLRVLRHAIGRAPLLPRAIGALDYDEVNLG